MLKGIETPNFEAIKSLRMTLLCIQGHSKHLKCILTRFQMVVTETDYKHD